MTIFHADDYVNFLKNVSPNNEQNYPREVERFNVDMDCPVFDGLWKFCQLSAGGILKSEQHNLDVIFEFFLCFLNISFVGFRETKNLQVKQVKC